MQSPHAGRHRRAAVLFIAAAISVALQVAAALCPAGSFIDSDNQCVSCAAGSYSTSADTRECTLCPRGTFLGRTGGSALADCTSCAMGFFSDHLGSVKCEPCAAGTFRGTRGASSCDACSPGSFSGIAAAWNCTTCPVGTFSDAPRASMCTACPAGTASSERGAISVVQCGTCGTGKYSPAGASTCSLCAAGTFSPERAANSSMVCQHCVAGSWSVAGSRQCALCDPGTFAAANASTSCQKCGVGKYNPTSGASVAAACQSCPPGFMNAVTAATTVASCLSCQAGTYSDVSQSSCLYCPAGTFSNATAAPAITRCARCPAGSFSTIGSTVCATCLAGQYSAAGAGTCRTCPAGTYSSNGAATCTPCPAGTASPALGATSLDACVACESGSFSNEGDARCRPCSTGTFSEARASICTACPAGTYNAQSSAGDASFCFPCTAGRFSVAGSSKCTLCSVGQYSTVPPSESCVACPTGTFSVSPDAGVQSCTACPIGKFSAALGLGSPSGCLLCPRGTFNAALGASVCSNCPAGFVSREPGADVVTLCAACEPGSYAVSGDAICTRCGAGYFSNATAASNISTCVGCPVGTFSSTVGASSAQQCLACAAGTFNNRTAMTSAANCIDCPAGFYSVHSAASSIHQCVACPVGTYSSVRGASTMDTCTPCSAGMYQDREGTSVCQACPAGTFNPALGASTRTACLGCPQDTYSTASGAVNHTFCQACPHGRHTFVLGASQAADCVSCPLGTAWNGTACVDKNLPTACDFGYIWSHYAVGCVLDVPTPFTCGAGWLWNATTLRCEPLPLQLVPQGCVPGTAWNPVHGQCEGLPQVACMPGYWWDFYSLACVADTDTLIDAMCNTGYKWSWTTLSCSDCAYAFEWDADLQACVDSFLPVVCDAGFGWDARVQACVDMTPRGCLPGFYFDTVSVSCKQNEPLLPVTCQYFTEWSDAAGGCVFVDIPDGFAFTFCNTGMEWNATSLQCECMSGFRRAGNHCELPVLECTAHASFNFTTFSCECDAGYRFSDFAQLCVPASVVASCGPGYVLDVTSDGGGCAPAALRCSVGHEYVPASHVCAPSCPIGFRRFLDMGIACLPAGPSSCDVGTHYDDSHHQCIVNHAGIVWSVEAVGDGGIAVPIPAKELVVAENTPGLRFLLRLNSTVPHPVFTEPVWWTEVLADAPPQLIIVPSLVTFDPPSATAYQWVDVRIADDNVVKPKTVFHLRLRATDDSDPAYHGIVSSELTFTAIDNDVAAVHVPTAPVHGREGSRVRVLLRLTSEPAYPVQVMLTTDTSLVSVAEGSILVFTPSTWQVAQTVTLALADDSFVLGAQSRLVQVTAYSADGLFNGWSDSFVVVVADNDVAGVAIVPEHPYLTEGASIQMTLSLTAQPLPGSTVVVTPTVLGAGIMPLSPVLVNSSVWRDLPITITAPHDMRITDGDHFGIWFNVSSAEDAAFNHVPTEHLAHASGFVENIDIAELRVADAAGTNIAEGIVLVEGQSVVVYARLSAQPLLTAQSHVFLSPNSSAPADLFSVQLPLTIGAADWDRPLPFTIRATENSLVNQSAAFNLQLVLRSQDPAFDGVLFNVPIVRIDNDQSFLSTSPAAAVVPEGGAAVVLLGLTTPPTTNVTYVLNVTQPGAGSLVRANVSTVTFSPSDWQRPQPVLLSAARDFLVTGARFSRLTLTVKPSQDGRYTNSRPTALPVRILDSDSAALLVQSGSMVVQEGATRLVAVQLAACPTAAVTVYARSVLGVPLAVTAVAIGPSNWTVPAWIAVSAPGNDVDTGNMSSVVILATSSNDVAFRSLSKSLRVLVVDDDVAALSISRAPLSGVTEGSAWNASLALATQPMEPVTVAVFGDAQISVKPAQLTFTPQNWRVSQVVQVTAVADLVDEGANVVSASHVGVLRAYALPCSSAEYARPTASPVTVKLTVPLVDVDTAGVWTSVASASLIEGGALLSYRVRLTSQPRGTVQLAVEMPSGHCLDLDTNRPDFSLPCSQARACDRGYTCLFGTYGRVVPPTLVFTPLDWNVPQTLTAIADDDSIVEALPQVHSISHAVTAAVSDAPYQALEMQLPVMVTDNDKAGLRLTPNFWVTEGKVSAYTVSLAAQPFATVQVAAVAQSRDTEVSGVLEFGPQDWDIPRQVRVLIDNAQRDPDVYTRVVTHAWTTTDPDFAAVAPSPLSILVVDDDTAAVLVAVPQARCVPWQPAYAALCASCYERSVMDGTALVKPYVACSQYCLCSASPTDQLLVEGAANSTLWLRLASQPRAPVSISVSSSVSSVIRLTEDTCTKVARNVSRSGPQVRVTGSTVTFNASNWQLPVAVRLSVDPDPVYEGVRTAFAKLQVVSDDPDYRGDVMGSAACAMSTVLLSLGLSAATRLSTLVRDDVVQFTGAYRESRGGCRQYAVPTVPMLLADRHVPPPVIVAAEFSASLRSITATLSGPVELRGGNCSSILSVVSPSTAQLWNGACSMLPGDGGSLGAGAACFAAGSSVTVQLGRKPTVRPGDWLVFAPGALNTPGSVGAANAGAKVVVRLPPGMALVPAVKLLAPDRIGTCDKLLIQAQAVNTGGREPMYTWTLTASTAVNTSFASSLLRTQSSSTLSLAPGSLLTGTHTFSVAMSVWYQDQPAVASITVSVEPTAIPSVRLLTASPVIMTTADDLVLVGAARSVVCARNGTVLGRALVSRFFETTGALAKGRPELFSGLSVVPGDGRAALSRGRDTRTLRLPGNLLQANRVYRFSLLVSQAEDPLVNNEVSVEVMVMPAPLVASIRGAAAFTQLVDRELVLNGSRSYDPSALNTTVMSFSWSCDVLSPSGSYVGTCRGFSALASRSASVLSVPAFGLPVGAVQLTLTVRKDSRSAMASVLINVQSRGPTVAILPLAAVKVSSHAGVQLQATVTRAVSMQWTQDVGDLPSLAFADPEVSAAVFQDPLMPRLPVLQIMPQVLTPGVSYALRLTAFDQYGTPASAIIRFSVNAPPSGGQMVVTPTVGVAVSTEFSLATSGWSDDETDLPIRYSFMCSVAADADAATSTESFVQLTPQYVESETLVTVLPVGAVSSSHTVTVAVSAMDLFGATATASLAIMVVPPAVEDPLAFVQGAAASGAIRQGLDGGDATEAQSTIASFTEYLNYATAGNGRRLGVMARAARVSPVQAQDARLSLIQAAIAAAELQDVDATTVAAQLGLMQANTQNPAQLSPAACGALLQFLDTEATNCAQFGISPTANAVDVAVSIAGTAYEGMWQASPPVPLDARQRFAVQLRATLLRWASLAVASALPNGAPVVASSQDLVMIARRATIAGLSAPLRVTGQVVGAFGSGLVANDVGVGAGAVVHCTLQFVRRNPHTFQFAPALDQPLYNSNSPVISVTLLNDDGSEVVQRSALPVGTMVMLPQTSGSAARCAVWNTTSQALDVDQCVVDALRSTKTAVACVCRVLGSIVTVPGVQPEVLVSSKNVTVWESPSSNGTWTSLSIRLRTAPLDVVSVDLSVAAGACLAGGPPVLRYLPGCVRDKECGAGGTCVLPLTATVEPARVTFSPANWASAVSVAVRAVNDAVVEPRVHTTKLAMILASSDLSYSSNGLCTALSPARECIGRVSVATPTVQVNIVDDDVAGVLFSKTSLFVSEAGVKDSVVVSLMSQPLRPTTVVLLADANHVRVDKPAVELSAASWSTGVTVAVSAVDDFLIEAPTYTSVLSARVESADATYASVTALPRAVVVIADNDTAALRLSANSLRLAEKNGVGIYRVQLSSPPTRPVVVGITSLNASTVTVSPSTARFTATTWNQPVLVTATAVDDSVQNDPPRVAVIVHNVTTSDAAYMGVRPVLLQATLIDNDVASVQLLAPVRPIRMVEGGSTTYGVVLGAQPVAPVSVRVKSSDVSGVAVTPSVLVFTWLNWYQPQHVSISALQNNVDIPAAFASFSISHSIATTDSVFKALSVDSLDVLVADDDNAGVEISVVSVALVEGGAPQTYFVRLLSQPVAPVVVRLDFDSVLVQLLQPRTGSLTFTPSTWSVYQTVKVVAVDDLIDRGSVSTSTVNHTLSSTDPAYGGRSTVLPTLVTDNDGSAVVLVPGSLTIAEGRAAAFNVSLSSEPVSDVLVSFPALGSSPMVQATPCCDVRFSRSNWMQPVEIRVSAVQDDIDYGQRPRLDVVVSVSSAHATYNRIPVQPLVVVIQDDDRAGVAVAPTSGSWAIATHQNATVSVALQSRPTSAVRVVVSSEPAGRVRAVPAFVTFAPETYRVAQSIVLVSAAAADSEAGPVMATVKFSPVSLDTVYASLSAVDRTIPVAAVNDLPPVPVMGYNRVAWRDASDRPRDVQVDGSQSYDPEGKPLSFMWVQTGGEPAFLTTPLSGSSTVSNLTFSDVRRFTLWMTDASGQVASGTVLVWTPNINKRLTLTDAARRTYCVQGSVCRMAWEVVGFPAGAEMSVAVERPATGASTTICTAETRSTAAQAFTCEWMVTSDWAVGQYNTQLTIRGQSAFVGVGKSSTTTAISRALVVEVRAAYSWVASAFSACNDPCGGTQTRTVACYSADGELATKGQCAALGLAAPPTVQTCSVPAACVYRWSTGTYGACSMACGLGTQTRPVMCRIPSGETVLESKCVAATKPDSTAPCFLKRCSNTWKVGPWSDCSAACGSGGTATRAVSCVDQDGVTRPDSWCQDTAKPVAQQSCYVKPCGGLTRDWRVGDWSTCSRSCGGGTQTRTVECVDAQLQVTSGCSPSAVPVATRSCNLERCETFQLSYTAWGECSAPCGGGRQFRQAVCRSSSGRVMPLSSCGPVPRNATAQSCNSLPCPTYYWSSGAWSTCSADCGGGTMTRLVQCTSGSTTVNDALCPQSSRPSSSQVCNLTPCQRWWWSVAPWGECSRTCGGSRQRSVSCVTSGSDSSGPANCAGAAPSAQETCDWGCDFCSTTFCSNHGKCSNGACQCDAGYSGMFCQSKETCAGVVTARGDCCIGVLDATGACCAGAHAVLDITGSCCKTGKLNGCGKCDDGSVWYTDVAGQCCQQVDAGGFCCAGTVDACGVCGGLNSCSQAVTTTIKSPSGVNASELADPASATRRSLDLNLKTCVSEALGRPLDSVVIDGVAARAASNRRLFSVPTSALADDDSELAVAFTLISTSAASPNVVAVEQLTTLLLGNKGSIAFQSVVDSAATGVCGNGRCEVKERCDVRDPTIACCKDDCPVPVGMCPIGGDGSVCNDKGFCLTTTTGDTSCKCFSGSGYSGDTCEECATGFVKLDGKCQRTTGVPTCSDGVQNGGELGIDCGGGCSSCPTYTQYLTVGAVVFFAIFSVVVCLACLVIVRRCYLPRRGAQSSAHHRRGSIGKPGKEDRAPSPLASPFGREDSPMFRDEQVHVDMTPTFAVTNPAFVNEHPRVSMAAPVAAVSSVNSATASAPAATAAVPQQARVAHLTAFAPVTSAFVSTGPVVVGSAAPVAAAAAEAATPAVAAEDPEPFQPTAESKLEVATSVAAAPTGDSATPPAVPSPLNIKIVSQSRSRAGRKGNSGAGAGVVSPPVLPLPNESSAFTFAVAVAAEEVPPVVDHAPPVVEATPVAMQQGPAVAEATPVETEQVAVAAGGAPPASSGEALTTITTTTMELDEPSPVTE